MAARTVAVTVAEVIEETADARSLVLTVPEDRREEFRYLPGQFLTVRVPSELTGSVARCYSLASSPLTDDRPTVTIKRTAEGYASNWLCDRVRAGDVVDVLPPTGAFTPPSLDEDLLLLAAGSGITPVISILKSVLAQGDARVVLVYANRDERSVIFSAALRELAQRHADRLSVIHWLESVQGLPTVEQLTRLVAPFSDHRVFTCGPAPFMDAARAAAAQVGVPRDRVHAEVFTSLSGDPFADVELPADDDADAVDVTVSLNGVEHDLRWPRSATLVDVLLSSGVQVPYSCREGACGSCACDLTEGEVNLGNASVLDEADLADGVILACQARPISERLRVEF